MMMQMLRNRLLLVVLLFVPLAGFAHVGSPDVYYDGYAGQYHLLVTVRPPSVIAIACFFLATSNATNASLYSVMVRPPCLRLGSVHPSNPRCHRTKGRPPVPDREHDL